MMNLFEILNVPRDTILQAKSLIHDRNDKLAHAKGGIEPDPESKISEYLNTLKKIHAYIVPLNDRVITRWKKLKDRSQSMKDYASLHMGEEYLSYADLRRGEFKKYKLI